MELAIEPAVIVVTTSVNGQMTFEIEDQEPKAKKAKISDESEEQKSFYDLDSNQTVFEIVEEPKAKKAKISDDEQMFEKFFLD